MSLCSSPDTAKWGRLFMCPERMRETTLSQLESGVSSPVWDERTEAEYFERIKAKAVEKAAKILATARADAESIRRAAQQEGYQEGQAQAQAELDEFRQAAGDTAATVLSAIEKQAGDLSKAWCSELENLVCVAVEAGIGYELSENRVKMLASLFNKAVSSLESDRGAIVWVHPDDEPVVADIINMAGEGCSNKFQVRGKNTLSPGSIVLESALGIIENSIEHRRALVDNILAELSIKDEENLSTADKQPGADLEHEQVQAQSHDKSEELTEVAAHVEEVVGQNISGLSEGAELAAEEQEALDFVPQPVAADAVMEEPVDNPFEGISGELSEEEFAAHLQEMENDDTPLIPAEKLDAEADVALDSLAAADEKTEPNVVEVAADVNQTETEPAPVEVAAEVAPAEVSAEPAPAEVVEEPVSAEAAADAAPTEVATEPAQVEVAAEPAELKEDVQSQADADALLDSLLGEGNS